MKKIFIALALFCFASSMIQPPGSIDILKKMHERFAGKWYKTFSFNQTTEIYRNDTLRRSETWYENIKFPDDFRIDF